MILEILKLIIFNVFYWGLCDIFIDNGNKGIFKVFEYIFIVYIIYNGF